MSSIKVRLPDQSIRELHQPTSIAELAASIGPGLAKVAVAGLIDGKLQDIRYVIDRDCDVKIVTLKDPQSVEVIRHSAAHIMAQAIQEIWPEVKITIGPVTETGFFYDLDSPRNFVPEDLEKIEAQMAKIVKSDFEIKKEVWEVGRAIETFRKMGERFKVEIIEDLVRDQGVKEVSVYHQGPWFDLCRGPHVPRTSFLKAFKLLSIAGAYWRGNEKNPMLQRIYGTAFADKKDLEAYLFQIEEAKKRDHRKLGKELDLFVFHPWSPASPFYLPKGAVIYNELLKYIRELYEKYGYEEVITPQIFDVETYKCSGHFDNYGENMYFAVPAQVGGEKEATAMVKAMNCPGHALLYGARKHSYRDLPWRVADFGRLHRYERAGVVHGLARVRTFSQDDAHIFCTEAQVQDEIAKFMVMLKEAYDVFGFTKFTPYFSTRPEKRVGSDELWDKAESTLEAAIKKLGVEYKINPGDGAFYGPKMDIMVTDAIGRAWQLGTIQVDFNIAQRFNIDYVGEDNKPHFPVVLHRAILGSFERFLAVYLEHIAGQFPIWLSPVQACIMNITESQQAYCEEIVALLKKSELRAVGDFRNEKLGLKIREAQLQKVPYMVIIGDQEKQSRTVSVRLRSGQEIKGVSLEKLQENLVSAVKHRSFEVCLT